MDAVLEFFNDVLGFLHSGIYDFVTAAYAKFVIWATVAGIKLKLFALTFAWDVAQQVLEQLHVSEYLQSAWSALDSRLLNTLAWFRLPEAINILISARVTRFVLDFMGV